MWSPVFASYIFKICIAENKDKLFPYIRIILFKVNLSCNRLIPQT